MHKHTHKHKPKENTETHTPFCNTPPTANHRYAAHRMRDWKHLGSSKHRSFCFCQLLLHIFSRVFCKRCKTEVNQRTHLPLAARNLYHNCGGSFELHLMGATVASSQPFLLVPSHPRSYFMYKDSWHGHPACHSVLV